MGSVKIPYYVLKHGRGYWQPKAKMKLFGFTSISLGPDGPDAWRKAQEWNERWNRVRRGEEPSSVKVWPKGSLGEAFARFKRTEVWKTKQARTREDWDRGWRYIEPIFGDVDPSTVDLETIDTFYADPEVGLLKTAGVSEAYRALKIWRALWKAAAAMGYCDRDADPSLAIRRQTPPPRSAVWSEGEVVRLVKAAIRMKYHGLACCIAVAWDSQFSPVDVRSLTPGHVRQSPGGAVFEVERAKTGRAAIGTLSRRTERLLAEYMKTLGAEPLATAPLFRNRSGRAYSKDTLGDDFRDIRNVVFPGDTRQLLDLRRSATVEASVGGVGMADLAAKMGNTINRSEALQKVYQPVSLAGVRAADSARKEGRKRLRENK